MNTEPKLLISHDIEEINIHIKALYAGKQPQPWLGFSRSYTQFDDAYAKVLIKNQITEDERFVLACSILTTFDSRGFESLVSIQEGNAIGGYVYGTSYMSPTGDTIGFLIGNERRNDIYRILSSKGRLENLGLINIEQLGPQTAIMSHAIHPSEELVSITMYNEPYEPSYTKDFPAQKLTTRHVWDDLVLSYYTREGLIELENWLSHHEAFNKLNTVTRKLKRGYRVLFHGASGTGKTLTATLLGQKYKRDVYHIDLSMMVSKYIGETEKNLKKVFDIAEHRDWILFFDEADAIFGKRTSTKSSNDRYANQEVSYLLQRIEDYPGMIMLATNFKGNMDDAFLRRFQSMVKFPKPSADERYALWSNVFKTEVPVSEEVDFYKLAMDYDITGATIGNVLRYCVLEILETKDKAISKELIIRGIEKEQAKSL